VDWDDLRYVLAVVDEGGLQHGAKALGVHATTLARRLRQMEAAAGARLFSKVRHGVVLTEAGEDTVAVAREMQAQVHDLSARLEGRDTSLSGSLRLTSVDALFRHWMPDFAAFAREYPEIELELSSGLGMANLTHREADIALRIAGSAPDHLIGHRLCGVAHGVYASKELIERVGADAPRDAFPWVSYDLSVFRGVDKFLEGRYPGAKIVMRVPRIDLLRTALEAGVGAGVLTCYAGDRSPHLQRIGPADAGMTSLWVLTHPQLRGSARIGAVKRYLKDLAARDRELFEGHAGS